MQAFHRLGLGLVSTKSLAVLLLMKVESNWDCQEPARSTSHGFFNGEPDALN
jgi:hypothetical protein